MSKKKLKRRIGEASDEGRIDQYEIVALSNIEARGLLVKYLGDDPDRKSIRIRDAPGEVEAPARVVGKIET